VKDVLEDRPMYEGTVHGRILGIGSVYKLTKFDTECIRVCFFVVLHIINCFMLICH
jgi:hypothetical protein